MANFSKFAAGFLPTIPLSYSNGGYVYILLGRTIFTVGCVYSVSTRSTNALGRKKFRNHPTQCCPTYTLWQKYNRVLNKGKKIK